MYNHAAKEWVILNLKAGLGYCCERVLYMPCLRCKAETFMSDQQAILVDTLNAAHLRIRVTAALENQRVLERK